MKTTRVFKAGIVLVSVLVPALVAFLFYGPIHFQTDADLRFLPRLHAMLNTGTACFLLIGYYLIRTGRQRLHRLSMISALILSATFLVSYVIYHATYQPVSYGGEGFMRPLYFTILISHISLAVVIIPIVLITFLRALSGDFEKHKKIARWTLPLWLYMAVTGVLVYLMLSPYY